MFSIIIPLYNKAAYIDKAIRSVLNQTYKEFELIVVNDGSIDDPLNNLEFIIHNLQSKKQESFNKIRIINQENQGVSVARNNGVKLANYDYIAFLDADDWWEPTYLEEMKSLILNYPEGGIYGSSYCIVKNGKYNLADLGIDKDFVCGFVNYCQVYLKSINQPIWTGATIIRKTVFESEHGFNPRLKLGEDFDLWIRVSMKYPVVLLNKPLSNYNQDVELANRAIGGKLYEPHEHMLFTDYGELQNNQYFRELFERLAVYSLLPYYLQNRNKREVDLILDGIHWKNHNFKYRLFYLILPKIVVRSWIKFLKFGSRLKTRMLY